jgi:hypothetical protein
MLSHLLVIGHVCLDAFSHNPSALFESETRRGKLGTLQCLSAELGASNKV